MLCMLKEGNNTIKYVFALTLKHWRTKQSDDNSRLGLFYFGRAWELVKSSRLGFKLH